MKKSPFINFIAGMLPEFAIAYLVMKMLNEQWIVFLFVYFAIQGLYLTVWLFRSFINWLLFTIYGKNQGVDIFYSALITDKYPNPRNFDWYDGVSYFVEIAESESTEVKTRVKAASTGATIETLQQRGEYFAYSRINKAAEAAIIKYMDLHFPESDNETFDSNIECEEKTGVDDNNDLSEDEENQYGQEAEKVRSICMFARSHLDNLSDECESRKLHERIEKAINTAKGIPDEFYRCSALGFIIKLAHDAGLDDTKKSLIEEIKDPDLLEMVMEIVDK